MPPQRVFELLSNAGRRSEWDLQFRSGELVRRLDVEGCGEQAGNALLHVVFEGLAVVVFRVVVIQYLIGRLLMFHYSISSFSLDFWNSIDPAPDRRADPSESKAQEDHRY